ncbi:hypothetical protein B0H67DRAFT_490769 [Lasiosphaeris hirsuta]|uniref:Heterokaryon incompatibility domain-containing protein n=1 Tax=Lasiosphaeris hirsuta TaxID=260670 RepID=A0AA40AGI2_9PEZI|nr:hypothetical protein B0H67DRAFT_490769 [Lasiosphaeris hirsuta]
MADYYQNSLFTIACTSATQTTGLFNNTIETDTTQAPPLIRLPYRNSAGEKQGDFYLCPDQGEEEKDYWENVASSELLSRGWVFQEWALSRRIVCCTSSDVFFRCKESPLRTASGVIQPRKQWDHMPDFKLRDMFSTFHLLSKSELSLAWMTIVEAYSVLQLTRPAQDRLVALSGVADEFGRALAQQEEETETATEGGRSIYVAGLWLSVVLDGLLWEKVSEEPHRQLNHIPSYSWASVYSRVRWSSSIHLDQSSGDCELIEVLYPQPENVSSIDDRSFVSGPPEYRPPRDLADSPRSSRFPVLCLRTKLQPVLLGDQFRNRDDRDLAARLTQQVPSAGEKGWRRVASHLDREHVAGWASLEHPEFQLDSNSPGGSSHVIFALHIARRFARSAPGLGYKMGIHSIFNVLFVRRVETVVDGFERIGVGALFGKDIERQFETAVQREIRLL